MFSTIQSAITDLKNGKMIIAVDDEDRENEGDFILAAEAITPEAINFMVNNGRGMICAPMTSKRAEQLKLGLMVPSNHSNHETAFTVSVDCKNGGSGISSHDRYHTIKLLSLCNTLPEDLARPGHVFPLIARPGGVLERAGHTEAAVDLVKFAGRGEVAVICEIMNEDGTMARRNRLIELAKRWQMKVITIKDLIDYRKSIDHIEVASL
jgi:3,4-dihydroxy 2-butanone 4-phosphate synthase/GTP cyclohydrolase II